jgi:26S proteasome regulatory subunit N9
MPAENRVIALADIAARTKLSVDGVEYLLMKALSVHLIEGIVDQVSATVNVTWVQPRVLLKPQIQDLSLRLDGWIAKVKGVGDALREEIPQLAGTMV